MSAKIININSLDSHQSHPNYVIAFVRFTHKETYYNDKLSLNNILATDRSIIVNDAISISVQQHKGAPLGQAEIQLMSGTVNYSAAVAPGDKVFIWMMHDQETFDKVSNAALAGRKSNWFSSGLKFFGTVHSVRQVLSVSPTTGHKTYRYLITAISFSELMTQVYFNEFLSTVSKNSPNPGLEFFANMSKEYLDVFSQQSKTARIPVEALVDFFLSLMLGAGPNDPAAAAGLKSTPNAAFLCPSAIRSIFGLPAGKKKGNSVHFQYSDLLHKIFGIQKYENGTFPKHKKIGNNYYKCEPLHGGLRPPAANFNNMPLWHLLHRFSNPALNEMYTTLVYIPEKDGIYPAIILRQMPFTTKKFIKKNPNLKTGVTEFLELPRWVISKEYPIFNYNLGTSSVERFNYIQAYTDNVDAPNPQVSTKIQIVSGNYQIDKYDILRNGVRTHITYTNADSLVTSNGVARPLELNKWTNIIADFFINGHLKMNGSIELAGIQEPIKIGDNFVFDGKIFHIEGVTHEFKVDTVTGKKVFRTHVSLSHGYYLINSNSVAYMHEMAIAASAQNDSHLPTRSSEEYYVNDQLIKEQ